MLPDYPKGPMAETPRSKTQIGANGAHPGDKGDLRCSYFGHLLLAISDHYAQIANQMV